MGDVDVGQTRMLGSGVRALLRLQNGKVEHVVPGEIRRERNRVHGGRTRPSESAVSNTSWSC